MAEWIVAPVMEKIIDACFAYLKDQVNWQTGIEEELQKLRDIQPKIQAVISVYSEVEIKDPALNKWYWQLRDAVDEADDVVDDFEYMKHKKEVSKTKKIRKVRSIMKSLKKIGKRALKIDPNLKRLKVAVQKLVKVSADVNDFHNLLQGTKQKQEQEQLDLLRTRETGSLPANVLIGRSNEMEFVKQWLRNPYQTEIANNNDLYRNISVLSVVGHGGMGKTTLIQHVYEDIKMTKEFDVQAWVCVSHNFHAQTVIKNILKSLQEQVSDEEPLHSLQTRLQKEVRSKRFLFVLDDIWDDNETKWENVLCPLRDGNLGSKILITTRMDSVASNIPLIKNKKTFQLEGLKENECLEFFNTHAFRVENPNKYLKSIARDIVRKFSGSPLAAKMISSNLKSHEDESYWKKFLDTDIRDVELGPNGLFPILKLSYTNLSKCLQICFSFCCIFPQNHHFDKDDLVRMWIALGFIQSSIIPGETLEDEGRRYFNILVQKSFFDEFHTHNDRVYYKMHDLLHDLAQSVSKKECFRVVDYKELPIPETIRHLFIDSDRLEIFKKIGDFKNLRSLFLSSHTYFGDNFVNVISKILEASKNIRLLYIYAPQQKMICEMIGCLTHLRYFNINSEEVQFPRSISQLYHLQFIIVHKDSCADYYLPKDINSLYNLRYLRLPIDAYDMINKIGKLKLLQELKRFNVKNEIGYGIGELEHMNELRQISIYQLENIKDAEEACSAKFYDKKNLTDLSLQWGDQTGCRNNTVDQDLDEKVLDSIQPSNNNLNRLCINAYMGFRSANWMSNVYLISNLEYIKLEQCLKWQILPPFGQLRFLKSLYLLDMPEVEQIDHNKDCMFPSLEVLHIKNLEALKEWFDTTVVAENGLLLPCLTELCLINCPKLQEFPSNWFRSSRDCTLIDIQNSFNLIQLTGRQKLKTNGNCELLMDVLAINDPSMLLMEPLRSISNLLYLTIKKNDDFVSFPSETEQWFLQLSSSLIELKFDKLQSLQSLPSLKSFSSLNRLELRKIPLLKSLPDLPSSLKELALEKLESFQFQPSSLSTISSLNILKLKKIPLLKSLPDLPSSLKELALEELESFQFQPSSLSTISSLEYLTLKNFPLLKSLPDLPMLLSIIKLEELENLDCLPSCLSRLPDLYMLIIIKVPRLLELPDLPDSFNRLIIRDCHPLLVERYGDSDSSYSH